MTSIILKQFGVTWRTLSTRRAGASHRHGVLPAAADLSDGLELTLDLSEAAIHEAYLQRHFGQAQQPTA